MIARITEHAQFPDDLDPVGDAGVEGVFECSPGAGER